MGEGGQGKERIGVIFVESMKRFCKHCEGGLSRECTFVYAGKILKLFILLGV